MSILDDWPFTPKMLTRLLAIFICDVQMDHRVQHRIGRPSWPNCISLLVLTFACNIRARYFFFWQVFKKLQSLVLITLVGICAKGNLSTVVFDVVTLLRSTTFLHCIPAMVERNA